jgi:hypothetical protein
MVICVLKRANDDEFTYSTVSNVKTENLLDQVISLYNHRQSVLRLAAAVRTLAVHGPLRPEETRGISVAEVAKIGGLDVHAYGMPTNQDENFHRTGVPPVPEISKILVTTADAAEKEMTKKSSPLTMVDVKDQFDLLRGAVMIAYPAFHRLPVYDPAREELEHPMTAPGGVFLEPKEAALWWAGKELVAGKEFSDFVGKNEKTKVVLKIQFKSAGPPAREPRIDEDTHKQMLAFYHKRQEELKKLKADEDDSYLASAWANPNSLKSALVNNGRDVSWRP